MKEKRGIVIPQDISARLSSAKDFDIMIGAALGMEPLWKMSWAKIGEIV